jgi:abortive infection bacteriophage resistance protein
MKFAKPATSIDDQIALLKRRGLVIADELRAKHYLRFVGYYRLAGYALPFQVNYNADGSHRFLDGVSFEDILDLYVFDRKLRLAVMDAVERIEVAFRAQFSQTMSEVRGPHGFMDAAHFVPSYKPAILNWLRQRDTAHPALTNVPAAWNGLFNKVAIGMLNRKLLTKDAVHFHLRSAA